MYTVLARAKGKSGSLSLEPREFENEPSVMELREVRSGASALYQAVYTNDRNRPTVDIKIERK